MRVATTLLFCLSLAASVPLKTNPSPSSSERLLESELAELPECQRNCARDLAETYGVLLKMGGTHVERYQTVCDKYHSSLECISHCPDPINLFSMMTSGIAYMCKEQNEAFNATIECVDASSTEVQRECDQTCNTQAVMFKWFMEAMHRMSEHGGTAAVPGGGLLDIFSSFGGMRADERGEEEKEEEKTSKRPGSLPSSVKRVSREAKEQSRSFVDRPLSFFDTADKTLAVGGTKANAVLDTVQKSITALTQPKQSPLFPSSMPSSKSHGGGHGMTGGLGGGHGGHLEAGGNPVDLSTMRDFTSDACQVSECFLACVKNKMNARCDGAAGSLLSEVFMRPIARAQESLSAIPLSGSLIGFLLPPQCRFLYDSNKIADYRMDSSLDEDLKRTYREKKEEQAKLDSESIMPSPLEEEQHISPFDSDQNLDELIASLYGKGEEPTVAPTGTDTVIYNGPIRMSHRSMMEEGSGEGSGEYGSGEEIDGEITIEDDLFAFEFEAPSDGEIQCVRVGQK